MQYLLSHIIIIVVLLINTIDLNAQEKGILRGFVSDSLNSEPLPYSNIFIKEINRGTTTDYQGYFIITALPSSKVTVYISYLGYKTKSLDVKIESGKISEIKVRLSPTSIQIDTVEAISKRVINENVSDLGLHKIAMRDIEYLPKGIELDPFRSLQSLPGVQSGGDVSSRFFVRGSSSNENLILLDNATIYNPFHAVGVISAVDPDIINSMEFYKSGFPVEYANRLSSVIKINTIEGNKNSLRAKAGMSLLTGKLLLQGPIPNGSFVINGRKNYTDAILKKFRNNNSLPVDFFDFYAKINYANDNFIQGAKFSFSTYFSGDKIIYNNPKREDFTWDNKFFAFNYFQITDSPFFFKVNISYSQFNGEIIPNYSGNKKIKNEVGDVTASVDFNYIFDNNDIIIGGIKITDIKTNLRVRNYLDFEDNQDVKGSSLSAYLKYNLLRFSFFDFDIGSRFHVTRLAGGGPSFFTEPRIGFTVKINPELAFKGSWGIFMQDLVTISDENEVVNVFEPWIITPGYLTPSSAIHYNAGLEFNPMNNLSIKLEGYYKIMHNLALLNSLRTIYNPDYFHSGSGKAYGLEFLTKYNYWIFDFSASYAWMNSFRNDYGITYHPRFDSRNNINLTLITNLGDGWITSCVWNFASGTPFTQILGYYDKLGIEILSDTPFLLDSYYSFMVLAGRNKGNLPDYHRLDLSFSKKIELTNIKLEMDFSLLNVYNRNNIFYFRRDTGERVNLLPLLLSFSVKVEI